MKEKPNCPTCGASWPMFITGHKIEIKGGFDEDYIQDICFSCNYQSSKYPSRPIIIMNKPEKSKFAQKEKTSEQIVFTARKGDVEINIKVGQEGLSKFLSMFFTEAS